MYNNSLRVVRIAESVPIAIHVYPNLKELVYDFTRSMQGELASDFVKTFNQIKDLEDETIYRVKTNTVPALTDKDGWYLQMYDDTKVRRA